MWEQAMPQVCGKPPKAVPKDRPDFKAEVSVARLKELLKKRKAEEMGS